MLVVQDGAHRAFESVVPLFQGLNEPLGGIDLLLDERRRLLLAAVVGVLGRGKDVGVLAVHSDFRYVEAGHAQPELPVD